MQVWKAKMRREEVSDEGVRYITYDDAEATEKEVLKDIIRLLEVRNWTLVEVWLDEEEEETI